MNCHSDYSYAIVARIEELDYALFEFISDLLAKQGIEGGVERLLISAVTVNVPDAQRAYEILRDSTEIDHGRVQVNEPEYRSTKPDPEFVVVAMFDDRGIEGLMIELVEQDITVCLGAVANAVTTARKDAKVVKEIIRSSKSIDHNLVRLLPDED